MTHEYDHQRAQALLKHKRHLVGVTVKYGFSQSDSETIVDLAFHAADQAQETVARIAQGTPDPMHRSMIVVLAMMCLGSANDEIREKTLKGE